jgi:phosphoglycerate dehydrogenase-like enzyme
MSNLLVVLTLPEPVRMKYYNHLRAKFPELTVNMVDHHSKVGPYIESTDILVSFGVQLADHVYKEGRNLKWIQALGTGVDGIIGEPSLREDVLVTNMHGLHGASRPESAILSMLALARDLPRVLRNQARHAWDRFPSRLLKGKTVGIFGVGAIAEDLAPKCKMFGMSVVGITSAKRQVAGFDRMVGRDRLEEAVRELDYLLLLTPYAPQTRGIVDARILAAMKPTSFLINLARGGVVDEQALIQALKGKKIAGAALDVFAEEPLPGGHPFWDMENVIVTPHLGGFHDQYPEQALPTVEENVRKFLAGDTKNMINVVRRPPGA